ncbi:TPA: LPXTG cell wall anchor domain-containing protein [Streptococcus suis]|nr:LPXTG cell wall anchor domain-containing protein [Streptococcus suis]HEM6335782.1 LPXTG cell wall anchor domain-containing protein [Streptococcus suis]HEM6338190.1 LPXTG cell wall anchor domain-containing protein [Streptococcus suis]HEM6370585.1 LPXTG cell wall anchor domain-containing protein [Streptococcus suis]
MTKKPVVISGADTVRKQSKLPQTGDATNIFGYVGTLLASAGALIGIGKKKEDEVE